MCDTAVAVLTKEYTKSRPRTQKKPGVGKLGKPHKRNISDVRRRGQVPVITQVTCCEGGTPE